MSSRDLEEQQDLAPVVGVVDLTRSSSGPALAARSPIRVRPQHVRRR
jgi:hypothetical protein